MTEEMQELFGDGRGKCLSGKIFTFVLSVGLTVSQTTVGIYLKFISFPNENYPNNHIFLSINQYGTNSSFLINMTHILHNFSLILYHIDLMLIFFMSF